MGMTCWLLELTPAQITTLRSNPKLVSDLTTAWQLDFMDARLADSLKSLPPELRTQMETQFREAQQSLPGHQEHVAEMAAARKRLAVLGSIAKPHDLDKSWNVLHYLFTGHADVADAPGGALLSGSPIGDDLGYGPPRLHSPDETRAFADFLSRQDVARLQFQVNLAEMARLEVYPIYGDAGAEEAAEWREEIAFRVPELAAYVGTAAVHGSGLLVWLS
jgi:hypothetical protein